MSKIFELFGYPLKAHSEESEETRKNAWCPFMGADCDGGGNRELSRVNLVGKPELQAFFGGRQNVAAGVCSIQTHEDKEPWIVCPRRLLVLGRKKTGTRGHQQYSEEMMLNILNYPRGTVLGVWPEVKLKVSAKIDGRSKSFDYTFDYVVMPMNPISGHELSALLGYPWLKLKTQMLKTGYTITDEDDSDVIQDAPWGTPGIVEIMTSSTSGGNTRKRTTIPMAFEDAILGINHEAPNINKRQVWARMVSQLIVKSEVAKAWGGRAVWLIQKNLADYINETTGINLNAFMSDIPSDVNLLSYSYGDNYIGAVNIIPLADTMLFSGLITQEVISNKNTFHDMIHTPFTPPINTLIERLINRYPTSLIEII